MFRWCMKLALLACLLLGGSGYMAPARRAPPGPDARGRDSAQRQPGINDRDLGAGADQEKLPPK